MSGKHAFSGVAETVSAREKIFSAVAESYSSAEENPSSADKTISFVDNPFSVESIRSGWPKPLARSQRALILSLICLITSCTQLRRPTAEPYFAQTPPPRAQEFRWSNGRLPKSLDPATASAPPETDLVRAVYEGLTDLDPKTLEAVPGVAESWESSDDHKTWTFTLREDAKWTNGSAVTAQDFVFAWRRLASMGEKAAHSGLLNNITGYYPKDVLPQDSEATQDFLLGSLDRETATVSADANAKQGESTPTPTVTPEGEAVEEVSPDVVEVPVPSGLGVTAIAADTLKISLKFPDKDFPKLVANPIFRPVYDDGKARSAKLDKTVITNGAYKIASADKGEIRLVRSENYWGREGVALESIRFIRFETSEKALDAYRAGEIDAVSNADFSPAALKLLEPYEDFRRATHSALNLYQFNIQQPPFDDRRVREALAISIERERLTEGQLEGSTRPAFRFTPFVGEANAALAQDFERGRSLLSEAGYPNGNGFPVIRLLVNRNDAQQRIARAVAKMWKRNLNLETEVIVKHGEDFEAARDSGAFDVVRRGVVLPTSDETANVLTIFGLPDDKALAKETPRPSPAPSVEGKSEATSDQEVVVTENAALLDFRAIPLYFPTSYSLVKPYVVGFDVNSLDAPSLRAVSVDGNWQPGTTRAESN